MIKKYKKPLIKKNKIKINLFRKKSRLDEGVDILGMGDFKILAVTCGTCCYGCSDIGVSDKRLKKEIKKINNVLKKLTKIEVVSFKWKKDYYESNKENIGFVAQNIEKLFPNLIVKKKGIKMINYWGMLALTVEAIKEINYKIRKINKVLKG